MLTGPENGIEAVQRREDLPTNGVGITAHPHAKTKHNECRDLTSFRKVQSSWNAAPNVKFNIIKLENFKEETLKRFGSNDKYFSIVPKAQTMKERTDEHEFMKNRNFCTAKSTNNRMNENILQEF